jgi:lantibiotic biosynthesis protein
MTAPRSAPLLNHWMPLVEGELAERTLDAVDAVADDLRDLSGEWRHPFHKEPYASWARTSLYFGLAGEAVFFAYLYLLRAERRDLDACFDKLGEAVEAIGNFPAPPTLGDGFLGVGWAHTHLSARVLEDAPGSAHREIDEALKGHLGRKGPWTYRFDLLNGLVGQGVYALERLPARVATDCLGLVVGRLAEVARLGRDGVSWLTPAEHLPPPLRNLHPAGEYNLGMAHGQPGVIALLAEVHATGVAREQVRFLLDKAISWLRAHRLPKGSSSRYADKVIVGSDELTPARSAWCYGDPGIAVSLLKAARRAGDDGLELEALDLARFAAHRAPTDAQVFDPGVCHGSAGLSHLFNRLFHATGETIFADKARFWLARTLDFRHPGTGIGGFSFREWNAAAERFELVPAPGILDGAAGVGLALLASLGIEPEWDRMLLTSLSMHSGGTQP